MRTAILISFVILGAATSATAQGSKVGVNDEKCSGQIYQPKEVTQRPKFGHRDSPVLTPEALAHGVRGRVLLSAVLCRTGKVTDIQVVEGLPYGMNQQTIEAARHIQFQPAERNGRQVSESIQLDYNFSYLGEQRPPAKEPIAGRLIETIEVTGLRTKSPQEIMQTLKTRAGEAFDDERTRADLRALLAQGFLDPVNSRIRVEEGFRGGVMVVFELSERQPK